VITTNQVHKGLEGCRRTFLSPLGSKNFIEEVLQVNTIFAKGVSLRRIREEDLGLLTAWSSSREAHGDYLSVEGFSLLDWQVKFAEHGFWRRASRAYIIELLKGGAIGTTNFWRRSEKPDTAVISIKIAIPEFRGHGYGYAAQKALINHLFKQEKIDKIEVYTDINNLPQQKCLAKLGFMVVESLRYQDQTTWRDGMLCRLTREQFDSLIVYSLPI
jgi:RimJ/RimL family protein N-acetyltransferase